MQLKQFVPQEYCAKCDVCCRFLDEETPLAPVVLSLVSYKDRFICQNFNPAKNKCKDYENRPLDCQLYPFVVMWDEDYRSVVLGVDTKCPYITKYQLLVTSYKNYLLTTLKDIDPKYISRFQDDIEILVKLDIKVAPTVNKFLIGDKKLFERYTAQSDKLLSSYSFIANYIWTGLLNYYWIIIDDNFCLFCKTQDTTFMPIPPIPIPPRRWDGYQKVIRGCFDLMNRFNRNKSCSRIEDIPEKNARLFKDLGYRIKEKGCEYTCRQKDLTDLAGDKYKAKRALCNYFEKNYNFEYRKFKKGDEEACIELFDRWERDRLSVYNDGYYKALLDDSYLAHKKAMARFKELGLIGRVVVIDDKICAYTFGYPLNKETFVVLFEVTDLKIKGLSQFIFRRFCSEKGEFKYINLMDDSGLGNLKRVKLSYHPVKIERTFCAYA